MISTPPTRSRDKAFSTASRVVSRRVVMVLSAQGRCLDIPVQIAVAIQNQLHVIPGAVFRQKRPSSLQRRRLDIKGPDFSAGKGSAEKKGIMPISHGKIRCRAAGMKGGRQQFFGCS